MTPQVESPLCVLCRRRPVDPAWRPFCSERCKMADLGRWAGGEYRMPGERIDEPEESEKEEGRRRQKVEGESQK